MKKIPKLVEFTKKSGQYSNNKVKKKMTKLVEFVEDDKLYLYFDYLGLVVFVLGWYYWEYIW